MHEKVKCYTHHKGNIVKVDTFRKVDNSMTCSEKITVWIKVRYDKGKKKVGETNNDKMDLWLCQIFKHYNIFWLILTK